MAPPSPVGPSPRHPGAGPEPKRHWQLPAHDGSVGLARRRVREALAQWGAHSDVVDDATLVISELATNVIAHTDSPVLILTLRLDTTRLRIEVEDRCDGRGRPRPGVCLPDDENGRGLLIVAQLAAAWGAAPNVATNGSLVWAELPWRRTGPAGHSHTAHTERDGRARPLPGPAEPAAPRHSAPGHSLHSRPTRPSHAPHAHASFADTPHTHTHPDAPHPHTPSYGHADAPYAHSSYGHADAPYGHGPHTHAPCGDAAHTHGTHPHPCAGDTGHAHGHPPHTHGASVRPPETGSVRA